MTYMQTKDSVTMQLTQDTVESLKLEKLLALPTIRQGQCDDLKLEGNGYRVWASRLTVEDGAPCDNEITVELLTERGDWVAAYTDNRGVVARLSRGNASARSFHLLPVVIEVA